MGPLSQRDATATRSLLKKSMRSSLRTRKGQLKIAGSLVQVGETGELALEMICQKIFLKQVFSLDNFQLQEPTRAAKLTSRSTSYGGTLPWKERSWPSGIASARLHQRYP